jgi:hypothetical protein
MMKNRVPESSFLSPTPKVTSHSTINEVRDSLKMPSVGLSPQDFDEVISDVNYDEISAASPYRSPRRTSVNTALNSVRYHQKELPMEQARNKTWVSSDASVGSTKSTKSTRSIRSFFVRKSTPIVRPVEDDVSVAASTKSTMSRWWNRSAAPRKAPVEAKATNAQNSNTTNPVQSFRVKKAEKRSVRGAVKKNDQLVADFFDVKSLASEPDFVGSSKSRRAAPESKKNDRMLETQSVSSGRSLRSNVFSKFFLRMRAINDEVQDIDPPNLSGNAVIAFDEVSFDDELTLGSSFDNLSRMGSLPDDYEDSSEGSVESLESTDTNNDIDDDSKETPLKETPFLHRIMQRRILKNESTILRDVVGRSPSTPGTLSEFDSPMQRSRVLVPGLTKASSTKSVGDLPSGTESEQLSPSRSAVNRGLCRWNSDHDIASVPSAPKRPSRGTEPDSGNVASSPSRSPKKTLEKNIKTSQSMRNLSCSSECKMSDDEGDDDSILSLLSGLLATWSAEREGVNAIITVPQELALCGGSRKPKSILKMMSENFEEQKDEPRGPFNVSFDTIEIREYERVVGDNPSCSKGPPISIGWECLLCRLYRISDYENHIRGPRRTKKEFHLAADKRTHLLVDVWERSEDDIRKARREATYIQYCRAKTAFSGSRAAAKEAAFLRKANDRSKNSILAEALNMMDDQMPTEITPKPRRANVEPIRPPSRGKVPSAPSPKPASARHNPFLEV